MRRAAFIKCCLLHATAWAWACSGAYAAPISLFELEIRNDLAFAAFTGYPDPTLINCGGSGFICNAALDDSGLGSIGLNVSGAGDHQIGARLDYEIGASFFDEFADVSGTAPPLLSWEVDEPFLFGDIFDNFGDNTLDNTNSLPEGFPEDVSVAFIWNFSLAADEIASVLFDIGASANGSAFSIVHRDVDDPTTSIFFSTSLVVRQVTPVPEPGSIGLVLLGLFGVFGKRAFGLRSLGGASRKWSVN